MPKKPPCNAFYFFMLDRKVSYEKNGEKFPNGLKDVAEIAGPEWEVLPQSERKKYEEMAKKEKERLKGDATRKYTNMHKPFSHVDKEKAEEEEFNRKIRDDIEKTIRSLVQINKIAEHKFYLLHVNYFCMTEGGIYHPAEIAICELSLAEGLLDQFHVIIHHQVPLGYRSDSVGRSNTVHQIPIEAEFGEKNFYTVWQNIKALLKKGQTHAGWPPMYTMPENISLNTSINCARSVIQMLCDQADDDPKDFQVYPLERLLFELKKCCGIHKYKTDDPSLYYPSVAYAQEELETDVYNYREGLACNFHIKEDSVVNCSLSIVKRWAYIICDQVCGYVNVKPIPGKHLPLNSKVEEDVSRSSRRLEREGTARPTTPACKPFTVVGPSSTSVFGDVEFEPRPSRPPTGQSSIRTAPRPPGNSGNYDNDYPAYEAVLMTGRGRGKNPMRGSGQAGSGRGPVSFAAAAQAGRRK